MRRRPLRALLATAALAACALGWAASAHASPAVLAKAERLRVAAPVESEAVADQSTGREADPVRTADGSRADSRPNGNANAAFLAAFVLAGVTLMLVVAASRVSSG